MLITMFFSRTLYVLPVLFDGMWFTILLCDWFN